MNTKRQRRSPLLLSVRYRGCSPWSLCREAYYVGLKEDPETRVKLTGNWEVIIGEQDTFCQLTLLQVIYRCSSHRGTLFVDHVLEYENYAGFDKAWNRILNSEVCFLIVVPLPRSDSLLCIACQGARRSCALSSLSVDPAQPRVCFSPHCSSPF